MIFRAAFRRIIPTRVGTSIGGKEMHTLGGDHPHACGDKFTRISFINIRSGSSPRVWGQGAQIGLSSSNNRIIPTRVGTSSYRCADIITVTDHPHACGDKRRQIYFHHQLPGSSPRVWGQANKWSVRRTNRGIIPTRVGTRK